VEVKVVVEAEIAIRSGGLESDRGESFLDWERNV
jgi:hypothetical protein